jgi:hypothetical protein
MSQETDKSGLEPDDGPPPVGTPDPANVDPEDDADGQAPDAHAAELRKKNRENQSLRRRLKELEDSDQARRDADLTEAEKSANRVKELEKALEAKDARAREMSLRSDVMAAASRLGIIDPDAAFKLLDHSGLDYDAEESRWDGVDKALKDLTAERPWLTSAAPATGGANPSNPSRRRGPTLTLADLKRMSQAEIYALPIEELHAIQTAGQ